MRVVFFGTPEFAVPALEALIEGPDEVLAVVSQPDRPQGRGLRSEPTPVARCARERGIRLLQPERLHDPAVLGELRDLSPDLIATAAFGRILRPSLLGIPKEGCLNVHASLLPRQRGAAPIPRVILDGDAWSGITIFRLDEGMDTGPILLQKIEPVRPDDTTARLTARLAELGAEALLEACARMRLGTARFFPQDEDGATYAPMLSKEDGLTTFARPAEHLDRVTRAFDPWPGAHVPMRGALLRLARIEILDFIPRPDPPGTVLAFDPMPVVATLPGRVRLLRVQAPGKREMDGDAWARGVRLAVGDKIA